jgi:DnaK suppressor protein
MAHLIQTDRRTLALKLELMRQQVLDELRGSAPHATLGESSPLADVHSRADEAETRRTDDIRFAEIEIDRHRLQDIERAQQRLAEGRYGVCTDCGEDIAADRLLALPTALRCTACQEQAENR